jgi:hypothetical protein
MSIKFNKQFIFFVLYLAIMGLCVPLTAFGADFKWLLFRQEDDTLYPIGKDKINST